ncbi:MAG TPA: response regulator [Actinomycetota bacterium]|nr:response regulator [Actinomycetota bacterium]
MPDAAVASKRVLFVSRDPRVLDEATHSFGDDVDVIVAPDARKAEELLRQSVPDAVVVDMTTGKEGGYALARTMSQFDALRDVPIIILLERDQDRWLASMAGARLARTKPIDPGHLAADVRTLLAS